MLFLRNAEGQTSICLSNIRYICGHGEYLRIFTRDRDEPYRISFTFDEMMEMLPDDFVRVNRSFIVNFPYVKNISSGRIHLDDGTEIPIGGTYKKAFNAITEPMTAGHAKKKTKRKLR